MQDSTDIHCQLNTGLIFIKNATVSALEQSFEARATISNMDKPFTYANTLIEKNELKMINHKLFKNYVVGKQKKTLFV